MKNIIIIRTPFVFPTKHLTSITAVPDIGTAYINGTLNANGYNSSIIDAVGEGIGKKYQIDGTRLSIGGITAEEIIKRIPKDTDYIGMQSMHSNRWIYDSTIIKSILENFPHVKLFLGGEHVSACAEEILKQFPKISACVIGEGEETVLELLKAFDENKPINDIAGISYVNKKNEIIHNSRRKRKVSVDEIPPPNWRGVPIKKYMDNNCGINSLSRSSLPIMATRGCPYSCTFCTVPNMWDSKWFARHPLSVVEEIKNYVKEFGVEHFDFVDLTIVIDAKWMGEFCDALIKENLGITWAIPIGTRTEKLNKELLTKMKQSGLSRVLYSAESGSKETLKRIKKRLKLPHFEKVVYETSKLGICVKIALIFGFPGQSLKEVLDTFKLINKLAFLGANDIVCLSFVPYPKTELQRQLNLQYDFMSTDNNIRLNNDIPTMKSWSEHFGDKTLRAIVVLFTMYFYALQVIIRPKRLILGFYRVFIQKLPLTNLESLIYNFIHEKKHDVTTAKCQIN